MCFLDYFAGADLFFIVAAKTASDLSKFLAFNFNNIRFSICFGI
jgi:hypothetical protein